MDNLPPTSFMTFANTLKTASAVIDRTTFVAITEARVCIREVFALFCIVKVTKSQVIDYVIIKVMTPGARKRSAKLIPSLKLSLKLHAHLLDPTVDWVSFLAPLPLSS